MCNAKRTSKKPTHNRLLLKLKLLVVAICVSQTSIANESMTLQQAVVRTMAQHADLKPYVYRQQAMDARVKQAAVSAPTTLDIQIEDALGSGDFSGLSALQTTLSIAWLLDDDLVDARIAQARQQGQTYSVEKQIKALDLASETAHLFITLLSQKEQLKLAQQAQSQSKRILTEIAKRVTAGRLNKVDQLRAKAALSKRELVVEDLQHEIEATKSQLAAQWQGNSNFTPIGSLINLPPLKSLASSARQLKNNPRFVLFATRQRVLQSEIALALVQNKPAWQVRTGVKRNEQVDDFSLMAGISIPLGSSTRTQGEISALKANQQEQKSQAEAWLQRAHTQALVLTHKLKHNRHVVEGLEQQTIPALIEASEQAHAAYQQGSYRYTDWAAVKQELLDAQFELINAYTNIQLLNIELERLTGASLNP